MAKVAEIQDFIRQNKVPKDIGISMLSKAEDLDQPSYQQPPKDPVEESQGFTDTFAPIALIKGARNIASDLSKQSGETPEQRKAAFSKVLEENKARDAYSESGLYDNTIGPYLDAGKSLVNSIAEPVGRSLGGDPKAPGALLGTLANFAIPSAMKRLGGATGATLKGVGEGLTDTNATTMAGMARAGLIRGGKGLIEGLKSTPESKLSSPFIDRLSSGTDMLSQATADPNALETMLGSLKPLPEPVQNLTGQSARPLTPNLNLSKAVNPKGPIAGVKPGITMNDIFSQMPEKVSNPEPTVETALKAVSNPAPNVADKALIKAQQLLQYETEPSEIAKLKQRIDILKSMAEGMRKSEVF